MFRRHAATFARLLALALLYVGAGKLGLSLAFVHASASPVWPPTGLALAAILLLGFRVWPAILIGAFIVNLLMLLSSPNVPPHSITSMILASTLIALGNTLEALTGAFLAKRFARGKNAFDHAPDVFRYILLAAFPATVLSAAIGTTTLALAGFAPVDALPQISLTWWTGDFVSDLLIAPLLVVWAAGPRPVLRPWRLIEALALILVLALANQLIFGHWRIFLASLATPVLLWAAFRFQQRGAITASCAMCALAIKGTLNDTGPFVTENLNTSLLLLLSFIGVNTVTALVLAAVVAERNRGEEEKLRLLERERAARADAEKASHAKDEFLAILSHELRTPLTPVMLTASALEHDLTLPAPARADIHRIKRHIELEARLINDLLDLSRVGRGKLQLDLQTTDLHQKIRFAAEICSDRTHDFTLDLAATHFHVVGDAARLQQILWNLLLNACKFTPRGRAIAVHTRNPDPAASRIRIEVADKGIGIDPDILPLIFNAFEQGNAVQARKFGGLGLGLAIAKALVEAHHGSITAASDGKDLGSTFTIELPTTAAPVPAPSPAPPVDDPTAPRTPLRVLLVEDHPATLRAMTRILEGLGHDVITAASVHDALEAVKNNGVDVLISDIGLPDASGYELMRQLKAAPSSPNGPLKAIALSGYGMDEDLRLSREAGFSIHLTKPVDLERLAYAIEQVTS